MSRFHVCSRSNASASSVRGVASFALVLLVAGCNGTPDVTTPTTPSPPALNVSGAWSAVLSGLDAAAANGRLAVMFDHRQIDAERGLLLGTWQLTATDQSSMKSGTVSGVVMGAVAMIDLVPEQRLACPNPLDAVIAGVLSLNVAMASDRLGGMISAYTCGVKFDSTIELKR
jgi:hypothetical protein